MQGLTLPRTVASHRGGVEMLQSLLATAPDISAIARWVKWLVCRLPLSNTKISKVNFFTYYFASSHRSELPSEFEDNDLLIIFNNKPKQTISFGNMDSFRFINTKLLFLVPIRRSASAFGIIQDFRSYF